jgi:hypothetical protein
LPRRAFPGAGDSERPTQREGLCREGPTAAAVNCTGAGARQYGPRGSMEAAEYKHVVLGLIFLKYISDAFEERYVCFLATMEG